MRVEDPMSDFSSGPLIVVGMWRSGTSLLYSLLNQHPEIALMYEGDLFLLQPLFSGKGSNPDWLERWEFWNSALSRHDIASASLPEEVSDRCQGAMAAWREYAAGAAIIGEKSPNYFDCLPVLAREFPGARFIILWRDLADVCRSIVRARSGSSFFSKPGILHRTVIGYQKLKQGRDTLLSQNIPVLEIQYEEMIQGPAEVMSGVCRFLEIPFDARMTTLQGFDSSPIYEGSHHSQVKGGKIRRFKDDGNGEVLSARVRRKIRRYESYWREQSDGSWPSCPKLVEGNSQASDSELPGFSVRESELLDSDVPGAIERFSDELLFRALRLLDRFTAWVYCHAPFGWLRKYRSLKNGHTSSAVAIPIDAVRIGELKNDSMAEEARQHVGSKSPVVSGTAVRG